MLELRHYLTADGKNLFEEWLDGVRDTRAQAAILARLDRLELGLFGDTKPVGSAVQELRIDVGAGYRVYYANLGRQTLLLMGGGDKSSQKSDISRAVKNLREYHSRTL